MAHRFTHPLYWLQPKHIWSHVSAIDSQAEQERSQSDPQTLKNRAWIVIAVACVCLLMLHYLKYSSNLRSAIPLLESWFSIPKGQWLTSYYRSDYRELWGYVWWGSWHIVAFIVIPMLTVKLLLKQSLRDYGWQWGEVHKHWLGYLLLATPIIGFAIMASFRSDFANHYPFYDLAHLSWLDLLLWESIYILQFVAVEFFFRGFLVNGLRPQLGSLSVAVMCLPYLMLHFPKLWLESTGAILFGFFLGVLALKSRSIWGGVAVHIAIALTMDFAAMIQTKGLPQLWLR
ncbi:CPBP family intramembrane glutamic endopeptidase [Bacterioplanoides pacificum]|uniref:CPBP family intramembrane glutamic endopeptidase n=1 Tax=Bacterioplanoides pacificum TaxID=1171596 RepID=A0ABV7VPM6_9GAMM